MDKYSESSALNKVLKNSSATFNNPSKQLTIKRNTAGNGTLGAISYLKNQHKYTILWE